MPHPLPYTEVEKKSTEHNLSAVHMVKVKTVNIYLA